MSQTPGLNFSLTSPAPGGGGSLFGSTANTPGGGLNFTLGGNLFSPVSSTPSNNAQMGGNSLSSTPAPAGGLFGNNSSTPGTSLFGNGNASAAPTPSQFGGGNLFGNASANPSTASTPAGGLFGNMGGAGGAAPTPAGSSLFGNTGIGATPNAQSNVGTPAATTTKLNLTVPVASLASTPAAGGLFGNMGAPSSAAPSLFGNTGAASSTTQTPAAGTSLFGNTNLSTSATPAAGPGILSGGLFPPGGSTAATPAPAAAGGANTWKCPSCEKVNAGASTTCEDCMSNRPGVVVTNNWSLASTPAPAATTTTTTPSTATPAGSLFAPIPAAPKPADEGATQNTKPEPTTGLLSGLNLPKEPTSTTPAAGPTLFGLNTPATTTTTTTAATNPAATAPGGLFGPAATPAAGAGTTTTTGLLGQQPADPKQAAGSGGISAAAQRSKEQLQEEELKDKSMQEIVNQWSGEIGPKQNAFRRQAVTISQWDQMIMSNSDKLYSLEQEIRSVEKTQENVIDKLTMITTQQDELDNCLTALQNEVDRQYSQFVQAGGSSMETEGVMQERIRGYELAEEIGAELDTIGSDLKMMIDKLNTSHDRYVAADNPVYQINEILNRHLVSLTWMDQQVVNVNNKIREVDQRLKTGPAAGYTAAYPQAPKYSRTPDTKRGFY